MTWPLITFLTDFGWEGGYVAACEATIATLQPTARVLHVSHQVAVGDVRSGALILARVAPLCPHAVHLAVVDPSVGTARRPLILSATRGDLLVGPDNGLLPPAAQALGGLSGAWVLDPDRLRQRAGISATRLSSTFHGRDVFAPAAALLSAAVPPGDIALPADPASLVALPRPYRESTPDGAAAEVTEIDRFGNVALSLTFDELEGSESGRHFLVGVDGEAPPDWYARVVSAYAELSPGELGVYRDSWGQVALALNGASAAELLSVSPGALVRLSPRPDPDK